jgi:Reverse transcriptase (RNA-dependent DNA polymerase)
MKQAGKVWYTYLTNILINELLLVQSRYDPCVLWRRRCIIVIYTDNTIITGADEDEIDFMIGEIKKRFDITVEEFVDNFIGVNIERSEQGIVLTQPKLIQSILDDLGLVEKAKIEEIPALSSKIL